MPSLNVDLGGLELESKGGALQLQLSSLAKFATSEEDDFDRIQARLTGCSFSQHSGDAFWIVRGHYFRMELSLGLKNVLKAEEQAAFVEILKARLKNAELFQQLHLVPTAIESSQFENGRQHILIYLAHADHVQAHSTPMAHKLGTNVPFHDVRPPIGVSVAAMDTVYLEVVITKHEQRKEKKRPERKMPLGDSMPLEDCHASSHCELDSVRPGEESKWKDSARPALFDDTEMLFAADCDHYNAYCDPFVTLPAAFLSNRGFSNSDENENEADLFEAILDLFDMAFRMSIARSPRSAAELSSVTAIKSLRVLADVAPTIWSAQYLSNVAKRAAFLPTISHALTNVLDATSRSRMLSATKSESSNTSDNAEALWSRLSIGGERLSSQTLSVLLWKTLARGTYNSQASRRLRSLCTASRLQTEADEGQEELLDAKHDVYTGSSWDLNETYEDLPFIDDPEDQAMLLNDILWDNFGGENLFERNDIVKNSQDDSTELESLLLDDDGSVRERDFEEDLWDHNEVLEAVGERGFSQSFTMNDRECRSLLLLDDL